MPASRCDAAAVRAGCADTSTRAVLVAAVPQEAGHHAAELSVDGNAALPPAAMPIKRPLIVPCASVLTHSVDAAAASPLPPAPLPPTTALRSPTRASRRAQRPLLQPVWTGLLVTVTYDWQTCRHVIGLQDTILNRVALLVLQMSPQHPTFPGPPQWPPLAHSRRNCSSRSTSAASKVRLWAVLLSHDTRLCVFASFAKCDTRTGSYRDRDVHKSYCAPDRSNFSTEASTSRQGGCSDIQKRSHSAPATPQLLRGWHF
jgi:hypothetical protein